jgi:hypothetical protein
LVPAVIVSSALAAVNANTNSLFALGVNDAEAGVVLDISALILENDFHGLVEIRHRDCALPTPADA